MHNQCHHCKYQNRRENRYCTLCGGKINIEFTDRPRLVMIHGDRHSAVFQLDDLYSSIGREDNNTITLNDKHISKKHASIARQGEDYCQLVGKVSVNIADKNLCPLRKKFGGEVLEPHLINELCGGFQDQFNRLFRTLLLGLCSL